MVSLILSACSRQQDLLTQLLFPHHFYPPTPPLTESCFLRATESEVPSYLDGLDPNTVSIPWAQR